jgi:hypothetical protein
MDVTLYNQFNLSSHPTYLKTYGSVLGQGLAFSMGYKYKNGLLAGITGSSPLLNHIADGESWWGGFPSIGLGVFAVKDFSNQSNPFTTCAIGMLAGYWTDIYEPDVGIGSIPSSELVEFKAEYYGGPLLQFGFGLKNISIIGKAAVNLGSLTTRPSNYFSGNDTIISRKFALAFDLSVGLRYSLYPARGLPASDTSFALRPHCVFLDFFGPGLFWSLNYEYLLFNSFAPRIGFSFLRIDKTNLIRVPFSISYLLGNTNFRMEYGIGSALDFSSYLLSSSHVNEIIPILEIRYQCDRTGIVWRIAYTPFIHFALYPTKEQVDLMQWPSISIGYSFSGIKKRQGSETH